RGRIRASRGPHPARAGPPERAARVSSAPRLAVDSSTLRAPVLTARRRKDTDGHEAAWPLGRRYRRLGPAVRRPVGSTTGGRRLHRVVARRNLSLFLKRRFLGLFVSSALDPAR